MSLDLIRPASDSEAECETGITVIDSIERPLSAAALVDDDLCIPTVDVLGLTLASLTLRQTLETIDRLVARRRPAFFITANLNYAMLCSRHTELRKLNRTAAFLTADGMPLIWGARFKGAQLPGRVTGADLTPRLFALAAERGYPVFILGAEPDVARQAADEMQRRNPSLKIAGVESPDLRLLSESEEFELVERVRRSRPRLVLVALGQPKGELWLARHYESLGDAVCVQVGAAIDFAAGHVRRAPAWMQRIGLEWLYRIYLEPRRLTRRYATNFSFLACSVVRGLPGALLRRWRSAARRLAG